VATLLTVAAAADSAAAAAGTLAQAQPWPLVLLQMVTAASAAVAATAAGLTAQTAADPLVGLHLARGLRLKPPPWPSRQGESGVQSSDLDGVGSNPAIPPMQFTCFIDEFNKLA
jgi:hypothetical protein